MAIDLGDHYFIAQAIRLAERGLYTTMPNPRVGCVLVKQNQVVAEGWHIRAGESHAEVNALTAAGTDARGATAYVSLEPCSHTGKTGPCAHALIKAGILRVVYAMEDPNPLVAGRGVKLLRSHGIEVDGPLLEADARALNPGYIKRMTTKFPFVRCKLAMSLDGRTAMASGESQWITSTQARQDVQRLRARSCAIISGVDTIVKDRATLTVRAEQLQLANAKVIVERQPLRVILDSHLRLTPAAELFKHLSPILLVHNGAQENVERCNGWPPHVEGLAVGAQDGRIDLGELLKELARRQCNEILIEAGATLAASFLKAGLIDELLVYMAPKLMGSTGLPLFDWPLTVMSAALPLNIRDIRAVGDDWKITAIPKNSFLQH